MTEKKSLEFYFWPDRASQQAVHSLRGGPYVASAARRKPVVATGLTRVRRRVVLFRRRGRTQGPEEGPQPEGRRRLTGQKEGAARTTSHLEVEKLRSENAGLRRRLEVSFDPVPPAAGFPPKHRRLSRRRRPGSRQPKTRQRRQPHPYYPHPRPRPRPRRRRRPSWRHCSRCCWPAARRAAPAASRASSRPLSLSARTFRGRGGAAARQARAATPRRLRGAPPQAERRARARLSTVSVLSG